MPTARRRLAHIDWLIRPVYSSLGEAMKSVGAFDAKTRLPELLRAVGRGESFEITHRGHAVALLGPLPAPAALDRADAVRDMLTFARSRPVAAVDLKAMIEDGRA